MNDYLKAVLKNLPIVIACTVLGLLAGLGVSAALPKTYTSSSQLMFEMSGAKDVNEISQAATYTQAQMPTFEALASSPLVLQPVIKAQKLDATATDLAEQVKVSQVPQSVMLDIQAEGETPEEAQKIAKGIADELVKQVTGAPTQAGDVKMVPTITAPANLPDAPSAPNKGVNALAGLVFGALLGVLAAVIREALRSRRIGGPDVVPTRTQEARA
ncbi:YveK family protein [Luteococcus peritonei]|uniref:YveK family protein n=1 Tax=Luteococcus peritonei TaxID=88874 RepID=A0ABW4RST4_9ACTN